MAGGFTVLSERNETGEVIEVNVAPGAYLIITGELLYLDGVVTYPNGTTVLTIKKAGP